ncbi:uncharacterized protein PV09_06710 [Verruconis gallopava]|uniref:F-box domain-containing protein n=1 Tax=Verruconis gallopava TaxID=253628 RepID=A0A0D1XHX8_9PEZI|nr:uncharacterized protein PV09_06710 [Verruconis gallopava]KIW01861.1 hypothetical protein PV09_06710 [Verruconis gallopava]
MSYFPFLDLPVEIREMVYGYLISFDGIQRCIDAYNDVFADYKAVLRNPHLIEQYKKTPSILLVNRQIHAEALPFVGRAELYLHAPLYSFEFGGLGLSIQGALLPDGVLERIKRVRFRFRIVESIAVDMGPGDSSSSSPSSSAFDADALLGTAGSWSDATTETVLLFSKFWAALWVHVLTVWIDAPRDDRTLVVERQLEHTECVDETWVPRLDLATYDLPTDTEGLRNLKRAIFDCWKEDLYEPLLSFLRPYEICQA